MNKGFGRGYQVRSQVYDRLNDLDSSVQGSLTTRDSQSKTKPESSTYRKKQAYPRQRKRYRRQNKKI